MKILTEGRKEFLAWATEELGDEEAKQFLARFLEFRKRIPGKQEADMDWWRSSGKSASDLKDYMDNFKSKTQKDKEEKIAGTEVIYEDDNWKVIHLKTYDAAKHYGGDSTWCITGRWPNHEGEGQRYFNQYLENNYSGYYLFANKHMTNPRVDAKYMVCPIKDSPLTRCDIYDQEHNPHTIPYIPNCSISVKGLPSVGAFTVKEGRLVSCKQDRGTIEIPEGVTSIKRNLFMESTITRVKLPSTLTTIESGAFAKAEYLTDIDIPDNVTKLGSGCFFGSGILKAKIGEGITELPSDAFSYCEDLVRVTIKGRLNKIDPTAFDECGKLNEILVPSREGNEAIIQMFMGNENVNVLAPTGEVLNWVSDGE